MTNLEILRDNLEILETRARDARTGGLHREAQIALWRAVDDARRALNAADADKTRERAAAAHKTARIARERYAECVAYELDAVETARAEWIRAIAEYDAADAAWRDINRR